MSSHGFRNPSPRFRSIGDHPRRAPTGPSCKVDETIDSTRGRWGQISQPTEFGRQMSRPKCPADKCPIARTNVPAEFPCGQLTRLDFPAVKCLSARTPRTNVSKGQLDGQMSDRIVTADKCPCRNALRTVVRLPRHRGQMSRPDFPADIVRSRRHRGQMSRRPAIADKCLASPVWWTTLHSRGLPKTVFGTGRRLEARPTSTYRLPTHFSVQPN
jgi:hypothetical protein